MKKLFTLLMMMACIGGTTAQNIGIGTAAPDTTAVLDIYSTNKGVLIPRILDTAKVSAAIEGLIIYNKNTRSPYYYDGSRWLSLGGRLPSTMSTNTDRITYVVTGPDFGTTEQPLYSISHGVSVNTNIGVGGGGGGISASQPNLSTFNFLKELDINSKSFNLATIKGTKLTSVEFKVYASGASVPYISYRYKNIIFDTYQLSGSAGGGPLTESISVAFENYGFKDWVNNKEFGYSVASGMITSY